MPDWWLERGIGETRLVAVERDRIVEARLLLDGQPPAGTVLAARLRDIGRHGRNAVAEADGTSYLLPKGAPGVTQGAALSIEVTREKFGPESWKRPLARTSGESPRTASLPAHRDLAFPAPRDLLEEAGWSDLLDEARSGTVLFPGGSLTFSLTPAMTLVDVDGPLPPAELAVAGAKAAGAAIVRLGVTGSIGIDLPTAGSKDARLAAGTAIDAALASHRFERTAVNGFGFLQVVRPRAHASLLELAADRAPFEARALLRRAARETGAIALVAHPAVIAAIQPGWTDTLAAQVGGAVSLRADATCAMGSGHAVRV